MKCLTPTREQIASEVAGSALNLPAGFNVLSSREAKRFRTVYSEAYMVPQFLKPVEVEVSCPCSYRAWPHIHSAEDKERARRAFAFHLSQGRNH